MSNNNNNNNNAFDGFDMILNNRTRGSKNNIYYNAKQNRLYGFGKFVNGKDRSDRSIDILSKDGKIYFVQGSHYPVHAKQGFITPPDILKKDEFTGVEYLEDRIVCDM